jgi:malate dehydrogenase (oxaloacetate-decarboxylating)(NADP+)
MARELSLAKSVAAFGGIEKWNEQPALKPLQAMLEAMVTATTPEEAVEQVNAMINLGHDLWAYMYMRKLADKNVDLFHKTILSEPSVLLPVLYTPTVGEACQKFGQMPMYQRGMYISIQDKGNLAAVIKEYADAMLPKVPNTTPRDL